MSTRGKIIASSLVVLLAIGLVVLAVTSFGGGGDGDDDDTAGSDTTTTTVAPESTTATSPTTTRGTLAPVPTDPPSPTSVPPGTVVVSPTTLAPPTSAPPATVAENPPPDVSTATTTPAPTTTTTVPDDDGTETVVYSPPDGPERSGELTVPDEHRDTAIVLVHDGDGTDGGRADVAAWASAYAAEGYVTLAIDYYLSKDASSAPLYPRAERDVKAAVQYLRLEADDLEIDPERIVVQGFGYGGRLACQAIVTGDDPFFVNSALYDDVSDAPNAMIGFYGPYDGTHDDPDQYYGGPPDSDDPDVQERYELANCTANAANASGPVLLVHGDADEEVPLDVASAFTDALTAESKDASLVVFEGLGHGFDVDVDVDVDADGALTPEGEVALQQSLTWLDATFPEPAPAP